jgi:hypothetical protein
LRADEGREMGAGLVSHWRSSGFSLAYIYPGKLDCQYHPGKYIAPPTAVSTFRSPAGTNGGQLKGTPC